MRLATLRDGTRDGCLVVVDRAGRHCARVPDIAATLQAALDDWSRAEPALRSVAERLETGELGGEPFDPRSAHAPLPRAYEWIDGSSYLNHVVLVRKARGAEPPADARERPARLSRRLGHAARPARSARAPRPG